MSDGPSFVWLERRLFEVLGGWVPSTPEPEVKLMLRRHSFLHAAHAERVLESGVASPSSSPSSALGGLMAAVAAGESTADRLVGVYEVLLPRLVSSYGRAGAEDLAAEEEAAVGEGRAQLERLGTTEGTGAHRSRVAALLADSGL